MGVFWRRLGGSWKVFGGKNYDYLTYNKNYKTLYVYIYIHIFFFLFCFLLVFFTGDILRDISGTLSWFFFWSLSDNFLVFLVQIVSCEEC